MNDDELLASLITVVASSADIPEQKEWMIPEGVKADWHIVSIECPD